MIFSVMLVELIIMQLFGTSGIRRIVDMGLIKLAFQVGLAVGTVYDNVAVGRDTRTSGSVLRHSVISGILASGAGCYDAGILPTPTLAYITREFKAGVMITASHNPPQYNGIKLLNPDGSAFSATQQQQVEELVSGTESIQIQWDRMQHESLYSSALERHISRIRQDFPAGIKLKVVVDSGCGAAHSITSGLLTSLGCEVISLNGYPHGIFPHDVEPIEANLGDLMQAVTESGASLGIAHDGDADRMMAVDELGRFISGDKLLAILALSSPNNKDIVTTIDASMSIEEMGFKVRRTRVGDPYVSEALKKGGDFGGEPSGAWVFPLVSLCPDGIYAAARITDIASRQKLSELADSIPSYPMIRGNIKLDNTVMDELKPELLAELNPVSVDSTDGLKLRFEDGWLLIRPSGTEPKLRITAEASNEAEARQIYDRTIKIIRERTGGSN